MGLLIQEFTEADPFKLKSAGSKSLHEDCPKINFVTRKKNEKRTLIECVIRSSEEIFYKFIK